MHERLDSRETALTDLDELGLIQCVHAVDLWVLCEAQYLEQTAQSPCECRWSPCEVRVKREDGRNSCSLYPTTSGEVSAEDWMCGPSWIVEGVPLLEQRLKAVLAHGNEEQDMFYLVRMKLWALVLRRYREGTFDESVVTTGIQDVWINHAELRVHEYGPPEPPKDVWKLDLENPSRQHIIDSLRLKLLSTNHCCAVLPCEERWNEGSFRPPSLSLRDSELRRVGTRTDVNEISEYQSRKDALEQTQRKVSMPFVV